MVRVGSATTGNRTSSLARDGARVARFTGRRCGDLRGETRFFAILDYNLSSHSACVWSEGRARTIAGVKRRT